MDRNIDYWHIVIRKPRNQETERGHIIGGSSNLAFAKEWLAEVKRDMPEWNAWLIHHTDY